MGLMSVNRVVIFLFASIMSMSLCTSLSSLIYSFLPFFKEYLTVLKIGAVLSIVLSIVVVVRVVVVVVDALLDSDIAGTH
mmetsp:Transcript_11138/g.16425  ORF Transcript_11138/g.16425 Transcript_11138/m.16425 type:complete len:80 (-) Transcript_11138:130-369(-)